MSSVTRKNARNTISLVQTSPRWVALAVRSEEPVGRSAVARLEANTQISISARSSVAAAVEVEVEGLPEAGVDSKTFSDRWEWADGGPQVGPQTKAPPKGADLEQEITIPFAVAVLGGTHHLSIARPDGKVDSIDVKIPAGIEQSKKIRLKGQGHANGRARGDLMIKVKIAPHPTYTRQGLNLGCHRSHHSAGSGGRSEDRSADPSWNGQFVGPRRKLQRKITATQRDGYPQQGPFR